MNINYILDNAYTEKVYKWNKNLCQTRLPNGKWRNISITADYLLKIPSNENSQEYYNLFLIQTNKKNYKKDDPIKLLHISAFPDCVDLSSGQERSYTILREAKVNNKTREKVQMFIHPGYIGG